MQNNADVKRLTGGKEIMQVLIDDVLKTNAIADRIKLTNTIVSFIQVAINERRVTLDEAKFNRQLMKQKPMLENFEKENKLLPVFTREKKENEKLSHYEIKQLVIQWHQTFSNGGAKNFLPDAHQIEESGPQWIPLIEAIYDHGGFEEVAKKLSLEFIKPKTSDTTQESRFIE